MWKYLLDIYETSRLNAGRPKCLFAETQIFNEGWLLRSVLKAWKTNPTISNQPFLPFPADAKVYSEGQLPTPFKARYRRDPQAETNTRIDGIAGHFSIAEGTKSRIELAGDARFIAVFEAKLYSPISKGTKNAPAYDQVSRSVACLLHTLLEAGLTGNIPAYVVVLHPEDNLDIDRDNYSPARIRERIGDRLTAYKHAGDSTPEIRQFEAGWEEMFGRMKVQFKTWERILEEIGDSELHQFYKLCREFNRSPAHR